jgi:hypothetical protein
LDEGVFLTVCDNMMWFSPPPYVKGDFPGKIPLYLIRIFLRVRITPSNVDEILHVPVLLNEAAQLITN